MLSQARIGRRGASSSPNIEMDIPRKDAARKRLIRRIAIGVVVLAAIPAITIGLSRLKPAAPGIDRSTVFIQRQAVLYSIFNGSRVACAEALGASSTSLKRLRARQTLLIVSGVESIESPVAAT